MGQRTTSENITFHKTVSPECLQIGICKLGKFEQTTAVRVIQNRKSSHICLPISRWHVLKHKKMSTKKVSLYTHSNRTNTAAAHHVIRVILPFTLCERGENHLKRPSLPRNLDSPGRGSKQNIAVFQIPFLNSHKYSQISTINALLRWLV